MKIIKFTILAAAALTLASCGSSTQKMSREEAVGYGGIGYSDIISYIVVGYQTGWEDMTPDEMDLSNVYAYNSPYCGFAQKDINGDGIPELLIGDKFDDGSVVLYDIYTINLKDALPVHLACGGERDRFTVSESGVIIEEGSNSASDSFTKAFRIRNGRLVETKAVPMKECPMKMDMENFVTLARRSERHACGGYSETREPTLEEYQFFCETTNGYEGMTFTPLTLQTQVVAGINYRFYCRFSDGSEEYSPGHCFITIYKPLPGQGEPKITSLEKMQ